MGHIVTKTISLSKGQFGDNVMLRNSPLNCSPRSCDLTPPDYFYGVGYIHDLC